MTPHWTCPELRTIFNEAMRQLDADDAAPLELAGEIVLLPIEGTLTDAKHDQVTD